MFLLERRGNPRLKSVLKFSNGDIIFLPKEELKDSEMNSRFKLNSCCGTFKFYPQTDNVFFNSEISYCVYDKKNKKNTFKDLIPFQIKKIIKNEDLTVIHGIVNYDEFAQQDLVHEHGNKLTVEIDNNVSLFCIDNGNFSFQPIDLSTILFKLKSQLEIYKFFNWHKQNNKKVCSNDSYNLFGGLSSNLKLDSKIENYYFEISDQYLDSQLNTDNYQIISFFGKEFGTETKKKIENSIKNLLKNKNLSDKSIIWKNIVQSDFPNSYQNIIGCYVCIVV